MARQRIPKKESKTKLNDIQKDIRIINEARKKLNKPALPKMRAVAWYENVIKFAEKYYQDTNLAIKMISLSISPYEANLIAKDENRLKRTVNKTSKTGKRLDDAIRYKDFNEFDSVSVNRYRNDESRREEYFEGLNSSVIITEKMNIKGIKI